MTADYHPLVALGLEVQTRDLGKAAGLGPADSVQEVKNEAATGMVVRIEMAE
ncbi:MAG: hypothetical protein LBK72_02625 [Bifidobacteriaceae bacterium]|nr:hypothetical protein [Bifidobacteriaceae bacterium]